MSIMTSSPVPSISVVPPPSPAPARTCVTFCGLMWAAEWEGPAHCGWWFHESGGFRYYGRTKRALARTLYGWGIPSLSS